MITAVHPVAVKTDEMLRISDVTKNDFSLGKILKQKNLTSVSTVGIYLRWLSLDCSYKEYVKPKHYIYDKTQQRSWNKGEILTDPYASVLDLKNK